MGKNDVSLEEGVLERVKEFDEAGLGIFKGKSYPFKKLLTYSYILLVFILITVFSMFMMWIFNFYEKQLNLTANLLERSFNTVYALIKEQARHFLNFVARTRRFDLLDSATLSSDIFPYYQEVPLLDSFFVSRNNVESEDVVCVEGKKDEKKIYICGVVSRKWLRDSLIPKGFKVIYAHGKFKVKWSSGLRYRFIAFEVAVLMISLLLAVVLAEIFSVRIAKFVAEFSQTLRLLIMRGMGERFNEEVYFIKEFKDLAVNFNKLMNELDSLKRAKENFLKELEIASRVQKEFLPTMNKARKLNGYTFFAITLPAKIVSGDFYGFKDNNVWLGDVSGKGVPASLFMVKASVAMGMAEGEDLGEMFRDVNEFLAENNDECMFASMFCVSLSEVVQVLNAGFPDPVIVESGKGKFLRLKRYPPLGFDDTVIYEPSVIDLKGKVLVAYSDGVIETENYRGEQFGEDRLLKVVENMWNSAPNDMARGIIKAVEEFRGNMPKFDDVSVLVIDGRTKIKG